MSLKYTPSSTMLLLASVLLPALSLAASTAVATSPIVTTITSTYYSTGSSSTGTSISQTEIGTTSCTTSADGASVCIAPALVATVVTLYGTSVTAVTTKVVSTVGYSTVYSSVVDAGTSSSVHSSSTQTSPASTTSSSSETSSTVIDTSSSSSPSSSTTSPSVSRSSITPAPANTSSDSPSSPDSSSSTSNLGPKVALAVAIVVGLIFISLAAGYIIKKRRDRKFKRSIGAPQPGSLEKGGMTSFVAMNEINKNKKNGNKPDTSTSTLPTIVESRPETATPKMEQLATNVRDPPIIGATINHTKTNPNTKIPPQQRLSGLSMHSPHEAYGTPLFEAPPRPSISADEMPPRAASLHQRRASTESARTVRTLPAEMGGGDGFVENEGACANPFHERGCGCRMAMTGGGMGMGMGGQGQSPVYEAFGQPRHEIGGGVESYESGGEARYEAAGNQVHEISGQQRFEMPGNPRYEMAATTATPVMELEDTSVGIGIGMAR